MRFQTRQGRATLFAVVVGCGLHSARASAAAPQSAKPPPPPAPLSLIGPQSDPAIGASTETATTAAKRANERAKACGAAAKASAPKKAVQALAQCKDTFSPAVPDGEAMLAAGTCPAPGSVLAASTFGYHVNRHLLQVGSGDDLLATTADLQPLAGGTPDTVMYLIRCDDASCGDLSGVGVAGGDILEIDDDGNSGTPGWLDSRIDRPDLPAGAYALVVASYDDGSAGTMTVEIKLNAATVVLISQQPFGGVHLPLAQVEPDDSVFVGRNNDPPPMDDDPEYHDTTLSVFSTFATECSNACGRYTYNDDTRSFDSEGTTVRVLLSRIRHLAPAITWGRAIAGSYGARRVGDGVPYRVNARVMHYRRHLADAGAWGCPEQVDLDDDGLSREIENLVGSCDGLVGSPSGGVGIVGWSCQQYADLVNQQVNDLVPATACPVPATGATWRRIAGTAATPTTMASATTGRCSLASANSRAHRPDRGACRERTSATLTCTMPAVAARRPGALPWTCRP